MNLTKALWILDRAHTRDDEMVGYVVETTPNLFGLGFSRHEYIEAWGVVRAALRPAVAPICNVCGAEISLGCFNQRGKSTEAEK